jgi:hypothetical protein
MASPQNGQRARWIIFALVAACGIAPLYLHFAQPGFKSKVVTGLYDTIEKLPEGAPVLLAFDFGPDTEAEVGPMARALLRHCFRRNLRVIALSFSGPLSVTMEKSIIPEIAKEAVKEEGKDFAILGFRPNMLAGLITMGQDFYLTHPEDHRKQRCQDMAVFQGIRSLKDFQLVVDLTASGTADFWIVIGHERSGFPLGLGCTAVMAADYYPYLQSGQLVGMMGGLSGAYQYEHLVSQPGDPERGAMTAMRPQSVIQTLIVLLIVVGNILYFRSRKRPAGGAS